jgi:serine/threonine protein kinase
MDKIGPYELLETLHRGPQPLYRAKTKDGKEVALKAVPAEELSAESRERFTREAETCRMLDHPNLVRVFDAGEADGFLYQAMELLSGADLGKVMGEKRHFTWEQKLYIMEQVAEGLEYAHGKNLVHRDIKPANLFLENSGRVRVLDFGMVRVAESQLTRVGSSLGTANYMAPEQIRGERCTPATDVFAAGIVFYQLASGRHPFSTRDRSLWQVVSAIVSEAQPKLSELCPDAPEGLEFILNRALEKDPVRRLHNAGELKQALGLCRMTMAVSPRPTTPAADGDPEKTRVMAGPGVSPDAVEEDFQKTRAIRRPPRPPAPVEAPPAASAGEPADPDKTKVMARNPVVPAVMPPAPTPHSPPSAATNLPPKAPAHAGNPVVSVTGLMFRYCTACTTPNRLDATVCRKCGMPLSAPGASAPPAPTPPAPAQRQWPLYVAIGVAAVLAVILVMVLMTK